ncbi:MAG: tetratricopeptide repeat protein [Pyrinomonadaceae bacterium]
MNTESIAKWFAALVFALAAISFVEAQPKYEKQKLARVRMDLGLALYDSAKYEESVALFREATLLDSSDPTAYLNLACSLYHAGRLDEAKSVSIKAVELAPGSSKTLNMLGVLYSATGRDDEALTIFEKAKTLPPEFAGKYSNLGAIYVRLGRYREAIDVLKLAERRDNKNAETYLNLAYAVSKLKKYREAIDYTRKAAVLIPDDPLPRYMMGRLYLCLSDKASAKQVYEWLLSSNSEMARKLYFAIHADRLVDVSEP